jgi:ADP-ribosyl-[dinitrogen reductase] hydrolase
MKNRFLGCLLGLACGDAVGTTVEFQSRGSFEPVTDMVGGGVFELEPGQWTDDTSMALCLATSLLDYGSFIPNNQMKRYLKWYEEGYLSSTGECFDIGRTTSDALNEYKFSGDIFSKIVENDYSGNGGIMRLAPIPMFYVNDSTKAVHYSGESSRTTHASHLCIESAQILGSILFLLLNGYSKDISVVVFQQPSNPELYSIYKGEYLNKSIDEIKSSGYVVDTLEAALYCFCKTNNFKDAILMAANLGDDADTVAAVTGQLAGAYYGIESIPKKWLEKLHDMEMIKNIAERLYEERYK